MPEESPPGLSHLQVAALQKQYGKNSVESEEELYAFSLFISQYKNIITIILLLAAIFSIVIHDYIDAFFILLVLVLNGVFGFIQEYRAHNTLSKLKELTSPIALVIREGQETEIDAREIVPGDIVVLREGDKIPADGKLISHVAMEVDESILTGESIPVEKMKEEELFSGTFVARGRGMMVISTIGFNTNLGKIASQLKHSKKPEIPLTKSLSVLSSRLAIAAILLCLGLIPIGILQGRDLNETILIAISVAVALIPEGLGLIVTIALAVGAYRMVKRKTIIRKMAAVETLGATNVILSDKTGTLTQNKMSVKKYTLLNKEHLHLFLRCMVLGNTASLVLKEDGGSFEITGDSTDGAFLSFAKKELPDLETFQNEGTVIEEKPFNPETKTIEVTWEQNDTKHIFVRGAPETILKMVEKPEAVQQQLAEYEKEGLRVIAFAHKKPTDKHFSLLGITGLYDAPRLEAEQAIREAKEAGIRIVMVTGDNPVTAKAIAEEIGLLEEQDLIMTHDEIEKMSDEQLFPLIPKIKIFARMVPTDKLRLVRLYKQAGAIVAVTGDGVNDALALSEAHIGIAMGGVGTDVAKEEADMVITDDNLYTVIKAVEEGRGIYDNVTRAILFLLSTNLTEFMLIFLAIILNLPLPLSPTQVLWINLVGDSLPAFALATDNKRHGLLKRKPRDPKEQILSFKRLRFIFLITLGFSGLLLGMFIWGLRTGNPHSDFLVFNSLVVGEMVIIFIIRRGIFPLNKFMLISVAITLVLQFLASTYLRGFLD